MKKPQKGERRAHEVAVRIRDVPAAKLLSECAKIAGVPNAQFVAALVLSHGRARAEAIARANGRRT